jgi:hypothetical protein
MRAIRMDRDGPEASFLGFARRRAACNPVSTHAR